MQERRKKTVVLRIFFCSYVCCCMFLLLGSLPSGPNCTNLQCECFQMPKQYISIYIQIHIFPICFLLLLLLLFSSFLSLLLLCVKILDWCACVSVSMFICCCHLFVRVLLIYISWSVYLCLSAYMCSYRWKQTKTL